MIFSIKNDSKAPEHIAPGPCCFLGLGHGRGQLLCPPARPCSGSEPARLCPPAPGLGAQNAPGRGLCLCSILKTAVDYLWQFTKNKRPLDKYIGGGGGTMKQILLSVKAGKTPFTLWRNQPMKMLKKTAGRCADRRNGPDPSHGLRRQRCE